MKELTDVLCLPGPYGNKWPTLSEAYEFLFNREFEHAHNATSDVTACKEIFFEMRKRGYVDSDGTAWDEDNTDLAIQESTNVPPMTTFHEQHQQNFVRILPAEYRDPISDSNTPVQKKTPHGKFNIGKNRELLIAVFALLSTVMLLGFVRCLSLNQVPFALAFAAAFGVMAAATVVCLCVSTCPKCGSNIISITGRKLLSQYFAHVRKDGLSDRRYKYNPLTSQYKVSRMCSDCSHRWETEEITTT